MAGSVQVFDDDGDALADRLESIGFGGTIDILPESLAPRLVIDFDAIRP